ncbi:OmpH family outer membrane protein [Amaricoccus solimangrovi]|nr:OmpH family outer membrane protein [Amaricoccus solimangrovi]
MGGRARTLILALGLVLGAGAGAAQEQRPSSFLFINQERLLTGSRTGQALLAAEDKARDALRAEARAIDTAFEKEERELNEQRKTMPADEFRGKADDFDARVVKARQDQDARSAALAQDLERRRRQFYAAIAPILVTTMERFHAHAIFDENSVLLADDTLNITEAVIGEIDAAPPAGLPVPTPAPGDSPAATPETPPPAADGGAPAGSDD